MDRDQEKQLLEIVRTSLGEKADAYGTDANLASAKIGDLMLDSLEKLQLILDLETALSVMANESEVAACRTVGELVALLARSPSARHKRNA
jgi:acyl carrier protein